MSHPPPASRLNAVTLRTADGDTLLEHVTLAVPTGAKVGLSGPNRAANSALLRLIAGVTPADSGDGGPRADISVGYLAPEPEVADDTTVADHVIASVAEAKALFDRHDYINLHHLMPIDDDMHQWLAELEQIEKRIKAIGGWGLDTRMTEALESLRCPLAKTPMAGLSNAATRRVDICRLLISRPKLLVLDEPTDDLDAESAEWLEQALAQYRGTVVVATSDRALLNSVVGSMIAVEGKSATCIDGGYMAWLESRASGAAPGTGNATAHELEWMRTGMPGRRAGATPGSSTFQRWLARRGGGEDEPLALTIAPGPALDDDVIETRQLTLCAGEHVLVNRLSVRIPPGAIVGVIGADGAGKTTLLRALAGLDAPDSGSVHIDAKVVLGYVDAKAPLDPQANVLRSITGGRDRLQLGDQTIGARDFAAICGFDHDQQDGPIGALPQVMRNRINLARTLRAGVNVLIIDETTRDVGPDLLAVLEDALLRYMGCVVIATNDRWFLNRVATHLLVFDGDSRVTWIEGNYDAYVAGRMRRAGLGTWRPSRLRFKRRSRVA